IQTDGAYSEQRWLEAPPTLRSRRVPSLYLQTSQRSAVRPPQREYTITWLPLRLVPVSGSKRPSLGRTGTSRFTPPTRRTIRDNTSPPNRFQTSCPWWAVTLPAVRSLEIVTSAPAAAGATSIRPIASVVVRRIALLLPVQL